MVKVAKYTVRPMDPTDYTPGDSSRDQTLSPKPLGWSRFTLDLGSRELTITKRARSQNCQATGV